MVLFCTENGWWNPIAHWTVKSQEPSDHLNVNYWSLIKSKIQVRAVRLFIFATCY
jgi:hypothetical protein